MALAESRCVYFCHNYGIYGLKIPDDHTKLELEELEQVWSDTESVNVILETMGMFTDHCCLYLVGGRPYGPIKYNTETIYIFNPTEAVPTVMTPVQTSQYAPIMEPNVFRVKERSYLFSLFQGNQLKPFFSFRSFDPTQKSFHHLNTPDLFIGNRYSTYVVGHFVVLDHIYLFIKETLANLKSPAPLLFAFSFDTRSTEWEKLDALCSAFVDQEIPFPYKHCGDTGISHVFSNNDRILVALESGKPTAYRVSIDEAGGSLQLLSHRRLVDHCSTLSDFGGHPLSQDTMSHLIDLGDQKFCVIYCSQDAPLLVYIFKIDFELEYRNNSGIAKKSVVILSSKKFKQDIVDFRMDRPSACLVFSSGPPSQIDHSKQHDEPVIKEEDEDDDKHNGVAYVEDFNEKDLAEQIEDEFF